MGGLWKSRNQFWRKEQEAEHFAADLGEQTQAKQEQFHYSIVASAIQNPQG